MIVFFELKEESSCVCTRLFRLSDVHIPQINQVSPRKSAYVCGSFSFKIVKNVKAS